MPGLQKERFGFATNVMWHTSQKEDNAVIHIDWNNSIPNKGIRRKDGYVKS